MKEGKPFFYRIDASEFFAVIREYQSDKELGRFIRQFVSDLVARKGNSEYANKVIWEALEYINKKRVSGSKGGKQRVSNAQAPLKHRLKNASSETQARSSTEAVQKQKEIIPYDEIIGLYNSICKSLPKVILCTEERKKQIKSRWNASGKSIEIFKEVFEKAENSPFLRGENDRQWVADFEFIMRPDKFNKVLDGGSYGWKPKLTAEEIYHQQVLAAT